MTALCTTPPIRPTFDVCPPWCAGHQDGYQRWEQHNDGTIRRYHDDHGVVVGDVTVTVGVEEVLEQGLQAPRVNVTLENLDNSDFTELADGDAHELGMAIVRAADTARRFRLAQEAGR
ncbi:hypothetical protein [uncultured Nocardioides sp.]|uniref:hypothetical protein n=1 Tax=uncultured Nocardioides sp. TaxID=198441 RepID=UPI00260A9C33|nr:hypothetical protein [uncultured Nocardioides sp.]